MRGAVLASGRVPTFPGGKDAACWLSCIGAWGELEGSGVCSFCGLTGPSLAGDGGLGFGRFRRFAHKSKAHTNRGCDRQREPARYQFPASGIGPGRPLKLSPRSGRLVVVRFSRTAASVAFVIASVAGPGKLGLGAVDAEGGGASGVCVDDSSARFNSASMSSAFICRFGAPCMARILVPVLSPPRDLAPARPIMPMVNNSSTNRSYQRAPLVLKYLLDGCRIVVGLGLVVGRNACARGHLLGP